MTNNTPISSLPIAVSLSGSEAVVMDQAGTTKTGTVSLINSANPANLPIGGILGQALVKTSSANYASAWQSLSGIGSVTQINAGTGIALSPSPITASGSVSLASISTGNVLANTTGVSAAPVPTAPSSILDVIGSTQGDVLYRSAVGWNVLAPGTSGQILTTGGAAANPSWSAAGSGSVSSVGLALPSSILTVTGSPVTTTGTLTGTLATQAANEVWAGPTTGSAATPTFRALVGADLPDPSASSLGGVQSVASVSHQWINSISTSGIPSLSQPAFTDISGSVAASQLPNPTASTLGGVQSFAAVSNQFMTQISTSGVVSAAQPSFSNLSGNATLSQLPSIGNNTLLSNISGGSATPLANGLSAIIDGVIGSTQGDILYRNSTVWTVLAPGTNGQVLSSGGAAANPSWATVTGTGTVTSVATNNGLTGGTITSTGTIGLATIATGNVLANVSGISAVPTATAPTSILDVIGSTEGDILYRGASNWSVLAPGTNGQFLQTPGVGSTPSWAGAVTSVATGSILTGGTITSTGTISISAGIEPGGRITLASGVPVMSASQAGKTTVYYTPYRGNVVPIYNGSNMVPTIFTEVSQATTDTTKSPAAVAASSIYDLFVWSDSGTIRCTRGPAWSSSSARGYTLTMVDGILLNTSSITNGPGASLGTWVGTIASNSSSTIDYIFGASGSGGVAASLNVWNAYNRVSVGTTVTDSGTSYNGYASATPRQARASAGNQIGFVLGAQEDSVQFAYASRSVTVASAQAAVNTGVGFDVTNSFSFSASAAQTPTNVSITAGNTNAGQWSAAIGTHILAALEASDGTNSNTFDASSNNSLSATIRM